MAKRVNNINYKGIAHTPSLVSDNDGVAAECINLAPDNGDLKPMPLPVKMSNTYQVEDDSKIIFVHKGVGYDNFVELYSVTGDANTKLYLKDSDGNFLYGFEEEVGGIVVQRHYWTNESEIIAVQSIGNTLVVSTKAGTEYLLYRKDVAPISGTGFSTTSSYKPIGQKPSMPIIEFQMVHGDDDVIYEIASNIRSEISPNGFIVTDIPDGDSQSTHQTTSYNAREDDTISTFVRGLISNVETRIAKDGKFNQPFFVRYSIRTKTNDYILHSPPVLMLPSMDKCPLRCTTILTQQSVSYWCLTSLKMYAPFATLNYKVVGGVDLSDWMDIVDGIDIFISEPLVNYDVDGSTDSEVFYDGSTKYRKLNRIVANNVQTIDFGNMFVNGEIVDYMDIPYWDDHSIGNDFTYKIKSANNISYHDKIQDTSLFHKVCSLSKESVSSATTLAELQIEDISSIATLPTLPDDYNSHNAISPTLMQTYNNRLNMANVSQQVFAGFENAYQPQSTNHKYPVPNTVDAYVNVNRVYFKVKKNGGTYIVINPTLGIGDPAKLDYTTYLYYPDTDCFEMVVNFDLYSNGSYLILGHYLTIPMKRHEYLNGSYWYDNMNCLGEYVFSNYTGHSTSAAPDVTEDDDLWYDLPNRFMMSAVGNPWYFPVENMFDIGVGDIRALSVNAENMDAPQFGQNPIYVFSSDGTWTIALNADGTFNKLSYVSGDVIAEPQGLGNSPTASAEQLTFFKTERGIMMMSGSTIKEIDLCMKGRVFNPKVKLLPTGSVLNGIPSSGAMSPLTDIINGTCDGVPYATFVGGCNLVYDYIYKRLMLYNSSYPYMYVYDLRYDFWSKLFPTTAVNGAYVQQEQQETRDATPATPTPTYTVFTSLAMDGTKIVVQDSDGYVWYMGGQADENTISTRHLGFYVSKPIRFGTDDYKTLINVVHNTQLTATSVDNADSVKMALYGSRDGQNYWRVSTLKGTSYKFFIIVLYTSMLPSSRYAYTAFEWEPRLTNKIR